MTTYSLVDSFPNLEYTLMRQLRWDGQISRNTHWLKLTHEEPGNLKQRVRIIHSYTSCPAHLTKFSLLYLDPDSLTAEFYQIVKTKSHANSPHKHSKCIHRSGKEHFPGILWGSITQMPILEASYFVEFSALLHPVFAHEEYHVLPLWQENDGNDTEFISSHFIKWFMISMCSNIDDVHLDHLIRLVAVKLLHFQITLPYLVIKYSFYLKVYSYLIAHQNLGLLI